MIHFNEWSITDFLNMSDCDKKYYQKSMDIVDKTQFIIGDLGFAR